MVRLHEHVKDQVKPALKKVKAMNNYMRNGDKVAIMYCSQCHMPAIEEKTIPMPKKRGRPKKGTPKALKEMTELVVKWCVFCEEPVQPKVMYRKNYMGLLHQLGMIYKGLRKNI